MIGPRRLRPRRRPQNVQDPFRVFARRPRGELETERGKYQWPCLSYEWHSALFPRACLYLPRRVARVRVCLFHVWIGRALDPRRRSSSVANNLPLQSPHCFLTPLPAASQVTPFVSSSRSGSEFRRIRRRGPRGRRGKSSGGSGRRRGTRRSFRRLRSASPGEARRRGRTNAL